MKKFFLTILLVLSLVAVTGFTNQLKAEVKTSSEVLISGYSSDEILIVKSVENGISYISIYLPNGILVMKVEEL